MIFIVSFIRLISIGVPNVAPIAAMALFGAAYFRSRALAFVVPLTAMLVTDAIIGFHDTMIYVYGAFVLIALIGYALSRNIKPLTIGISAMAASVLFFIVTNFGVWLMIPGPHNLATLMVVYELGIPFFKYTLVGDLFFCGVLFGGYELIKRYVPALQLKQA